MKDRANALEITLEEQIPIKQGLKRQPGDGGSGSGWLEEQIPIKQGLKHGLPDIIQLNQLLEEQIPIKQGLKQ